jgi:hypothetical protein
VRELAQVFLLVGQGEVNQGSALLVREDVVECGNDTGD